MSINKRIQIEFNKLTKDPPPGVSARLVKDERDNDIYNQWIATINGPDEYPWKDSQFELSVNFPTNYPFSPPHIRFSTRIYHPNISSDGSICLDTLSKNWAPGLGMGQIFLMIISLLTDPNTNDPLNSDAASKHKNNKTEYDKKVREYVEKYALKNSAQPNQQAQSTQQTQTTQQAQPTDLPVLHELADIDNDDDDDDSEVD